MADVYWTFYYEPARNGTADTFGFTAGSVANLVEVRNWDPIDTSALRTYLNQHADAVVNAEGVMNGIYEPTKPYLVLIKGARVPTTKTLGPSF